MARQFSPAAAKYWPRQLASGSLVWSFGGRWSFLKDILSCKIPGHALFFDPVTCDHCEQGENKLWYEYNSDLGCGVTSDLEKFLL